MASTNDQSNASRELQVNVMSSSAAGFVARFVCHPLDTLKSRIQAPVSKSVEFDGIRKAFRTTVAEEGVAGLYRGIGAVLLGGIPATSLYLTTYELSKGMLGRYKLFQDSPFLAYFTGGMIAEMISCIAFVPVDVVKERLQVQRSGVRGTSSNPGVATTNYRGSIHALRTIFKEEGVRGVYRGYGATLFSFGPFSAFYFLFYEELKGFISRRSDLDQPTLPFLWTLFCSSSAGAAAAVVTNPLDLIKLRLQISRAGNLSSSSSICSVFLASLKSDGFVGLFRGATARVAFHGPNVAVTMAAFEFARAKFK